MVKKKGKKSKSSGSKKSSKSKSSKDTKYTKPAPAEFPFEYSELVTLRVIQFNWEYHDMLITIPKSSTIYRVQCEIAKNLHNGAISPSNVQIYAKIPATRFEKDGVSSSFQDTEGIESETEDVQFCSQVFENLPAYFPQIQTFDLNKPSENKGNHIYYEILHNTMSDRMCDFHRKVRNTISNLKRISEQDNSTTGSIGKMPMYPGVIHVRDIHHYISEIKVYIQNLNRSNTYQPKFHTSFGSQQGLHPQQQNFNKSKLSPNSATFFTHQHHPSITVNHHSISKHVSQPNDQFSPLLDYLPPSTPHAVTIYYDIKHCDKQIYNNNNQHSVTKEYNVDNNEVDLESKLETSLGDSFNRDPIKSLCVFNPQDALIMNYGMWE